MRSQIIKFNFLLILGTVPTGCAELRPLNVFSDANLARVEEAGAETKKGEAVADALMEKGQFGPAMQIYENLIARTELEDQASLFLKHARSAASLGLNKKATKSFEKLSYFEDHKCDAYMGLGKVQLKLGRPTTANQAFAACKSIEAKNAAAKEWFYISSLFIEDEKDAQKFLKKLALSHPTDLFRQNNYAISLILQKDLTKAKQHLETYAFSNLSNQRIRHNLALTYALLGDDGAAKHISLLDVPPDAADINISYYRYIRESADQDALKSLLLGVRE